MYEIRILGRKRDKDCIYSHFGQASVYTLRKAVTFSPQNARFGIGLLLRVQNPNPPPQAIRFGFETVDQV